MTTSTPVIESRCCGEDHRFTAWNFSNSKRILDFVSAAFALALASPVILLTGIAVKLGSQGPVLFKQTRLGRNGKPFQIMKFRTMYSSGGGPKVTRGGDSRITAIGRVLRKAKLDELPQLVNVLRGDMSLVGPRPEVPEYAKLAPELHALSSLRPGITGWATLHFRNEQEVLASVPEPDLVHYYLTELLPRKAKLDSEYATRASFRNDLRVIISTFFHHQTTVASITRSASCG